MAMDDAEAQRQIQQMVNFILNEAKDKAQEIEAKALEDFNIEKLKLVQQMKDTIRQEFQKKAKHQEMQRSIARSTAINKARLRKIAARDQVVKEVCNCAANQLVEAASDQKVYEDVIVDLLVQGGLRLLEEKLLVRCRECDKAVVDRALPVAMKKYEDVLFKECGVTRKLVLQLDVSGRYLPPPPDLTTPGSAASAASSFRRVTERSVVTTRSTLGSEWLCRTAPPRFAEISSRKSVRGERSVGRGLRRFPFFALVAVAAVVMGVASCAEPDLHLH